MPIDNLGRVHFDDGQIQDINKSLNAVIQTLSEMAVNLNPTERRKYGKVGEQNKLLINKVRDYHKTQPGLRSPEIDWDEYEKDYHNRAEASQMLSKIKTIETLLMNIKIVSDYDNYTDALRDYQYSKYKNRFGDQSGFSHKVDALKIFFPKTGKSRKEKK